MAKIYTGIGSRSVPIPIAKQMTEFAIEAAKLGWTLRSGAAKGADSAFELGAVEKEIFLPWQGFNYHKSNLCPPTSDAYKIASTIHPTYNGLQLSAKHLIARNMHQVMGYDMKTPTEFVICWTPDGAETHVQYSKRTGGTGTAIALASLAGIPVFNINRPGRLEDAMEYLINLSGG